MTTPDRLTPAHLELLLEVTRALAAPMPLQALLGTVADVACRVLSAERCSVWLHDEVRDELVLQVASDLQEVRLPLGVGLIGLSARERRPINVPDCYADPRFDRAMDQRSGFRTRCSLTLPLLDHEGQLVGAMQLLNRAGGVFDDIDERLALALAAQCAVALQRARWTQALLQGERARHELALAREVQTSTLPRTMPQRPGWDCHGLALPATETGGDTFDLAALPQGLLVVLADATGHGIGPALSVTQMHAMLRMALRLGTPLAQAVVQLNDLLAQTLAEDRFITAFIGLLDDATATLHYLSAGQGPILHWQAASGRCAEHRPTGPPLGALPQARQRAPQALPLAPGDMLVLLSDGVYEQENEAGECFGSARVSALVAAHRHDGAAVLADALLAELRAFAGAAPQHDDVTIVLLKRQATQRRQVFERETAALPALFAFSAAACAEVGLPDELRGRLDFVLEELFTNVVKYGGGRAAVAVALTCDASGVRGWIEDPDGRDFDPRQAPEVDVHVPVEQRQPGGLGLHLIKRLADSIEHRAPTDGHGPGVGFTLIRRDAAGPGLQGGRDAGD